MDILDIIKADHRQVETLFSEIESTENPQKLYECFNQLYQALNVHVEVEEQTFYPAIRNCQDVDKLVDEAHKEHNQAKQILEDVSSFSPTSTEFKAKIRDLKQAVQHHVEEEENEIFPQVRKCMNEQEREKLGNEFEAAKSKVESEMSVAT